MTELARAPQDARGWHGSPRHLPQPVLRAMAVAARPISPAFARQNCTVLAMDTAELPVDAPVADSLGLPARSVSDVLARFVAR